MSEHGEAHKHPVRMALVPSRLPLSGWGKCPTMQALGRIFFLGALVAWHPAVFAASDDPNTRLTLRGVQGVHVVVEEIDPDAEHNGLHRLQLQADIEVWLRQAGIRVWPRAEHWEQSRRPTLYVRVTTAKDVRSGLYAVNVSVELQQAVLLARDPALGVVTPTWSTAGLGILTAEQIPVIQEDIGAYVADFIHDYLTANAAQAPEPVPPSSPKPPDQHPASWPRWGDEFSDP